MLLVGSRDAFTMPLQLCLYFLKGDTALIPLITAVKYCLLCIFKVHFKNYKVFYTNPVFSIKQPNLRIKKMSNRVKRQKETNFCNFD